MAEEKKSALMEAENPEKSPIQKVGKSPLFSTKGLLILVVVLVVEAAAFLAFISVDSRPGLKMSGAKAQAQSQEQVASSQEDAFEAFINVGRAVLDLGEFKVSISSSQPRAPRSINLSIQVVVTSDLDQNLAKEGGKGKYNPQRDVLILNMRSILREMMDTEGIRLIEPSAKADFERRAKDRLNLVQIDGDMEKARVLKILRGQVLQVIIDKFNPQSF